MSAYSPLRTCVGCGEIKPRSALLRMTVRDGAAAFDESGKMLGRGAYVCAKRDCLDEAMAKGRIRRALRLGKGAEVSEDLVARLSDHMKH